MMHKILMVALMSTTPIPVHAEMSCDSLSSFAARVTVLKQHEVSSDRLRGTLDGYLTTKQLDMKVLNQVIEIIYDSGNETTPGILATRVHRMCLESELFTDEDSEPVKGGI